MSIPELISVAELEQVTEKHMVALERCRELDTEGFMDQFESPCDEQRAILVALCEVLGIHKNTTQYNMVAGGGGGCEVTCSRCGKLNYLP